jgi:hypothetical protein
MTDIDRLRKAILDLHGCDSFHAGSIAVHETFQGQTIWRGVVEVFELRGHPTATNAYAWSYKTDAGETRYVAVLGVPPVNSAADAVRAYVIANSKASKGSQ